MTGTRPRGPVWGVPRRHPAVAFVLLTYAFTWGVQVPAALLTSSRALQFAAVTVGAFGPLVAATVLVWRGEATLRAWFGDTLSWRVAPRWYLAAFGVPLLGVVGQTVAYAAFFGEPDPSVLPGRLAMWVGLFPVALLLTGGNEEFGWRGYLLPRLQRSHGALAASLLVGAAWLGWHLPADLLLTALGGGTTWTVGRLALRAATVPLAVVLTWLYNSTEGSVVVTMCLHAGWNSLSVLVPAPFPGAGPTAATAGSALEVAGVGVVTVVALALVARYGRRTLAASERHTGPFETG